MLLSLVRQRHLPATDNPPWAEKTATTLRCESGDGRRTFVFHYDDEIKPECLNYIEMFRNDKGDMVSYHKDKEDNSVSLDH